MSIGVSASPSLPREGEGDFRPQCKGPYGKFVVTEWRET
jgi:hypothetical protein